MLKFVQSSDVFKWELEYYRLYGGMFMRFSLFRLMLMIPQSHLRTDMVLLQPVPLGSVVHQAHGTFA